MPKSELIKKIKSHKKSPKKRSPKKSTLQKPKYSLNKDLVLRQLVLSKKYIIVPRFPYLIPRNVNLDTDKYLNKKLNREYTFYREDPNNKCIKMFKMKSDMTFKQLLNRLSLYFDYTPNKGKLHLKGLKFINNQGDVCLRFGLLYT